MREVRKEYGITGTAMAKHLAISLDQLNRVERGITSLRLDPTWEFCRLTNTNPYWLAFGEPYERGAFIPFGSSPAGVGSSELFLPRMREAREHGPLRITQPQEARLSLSAEQRKIRMLAQSGFKRYLSRMPVTTVLLPSWEELRTWLIEATSLPGAKAALARRFNVKPAAVSQWLSGATAPTAATTLRLLKWVVDRGDVKPETNTPDVREHDQRRTRKSKSTSHEKAKSDRKKK